MQLTKRQEQVLDYIRSYLEKEGIIPTVREICDHFGLKGPAGIHRILHVLIEKGFLESTSNKKRSWRFPGGHVGKTLPVVGRIAAGTPIMATENKEDELLMDPSIFGDETCFALRVQGDSMIEAHIADGDLAIIRPQARVENGEIAAVIVDGIIEEATLKIVKKSIPATELLPANSAYDPMIFKGKQRKKIRIVGKLVGIIRRSLK